MGLDGLLAESKQALERITRNNNDIKREGARYARHASVGSAERVAPQSSSSSSSSNSQPPPPKEHQSNSQRPSEKHHNISQNPPKEHQSNSQQPSKEHQSNSQQPSEEHQSISQNPSEERQSNSQHLSEEDQNPTEVKPMVRPERIAPRRAATSSPNDATGNHHSWLQPPSPERVAHALLVACHSIFSMALAVLCRLPAVLMWAVVFGAKLLPLLLVVLAGLSFFYYGIQGTEILKQTACSFEPLRYSINHHSSLEWCTEPATSPRTTLHDDPWAKDTLAGLYTNLPAIYRVDRVFYDLRENHLRRFRVDVEMLNKIDALENGHEMVQTLAVIDTALDRGSNASRHFVIYTDLLMSKAHTQMGQYRRSLLRQFEQNNPGDRSWLGALIHDLMMRVPFLAKLDAADALITAITHVAYTITTEIADLLLMAKCAFDAIEAIQIQLDKMDWHVAQETHTFETDCNVYPWQSKPRKCYSVSLYQHRDKMRRFVTEIAVFKENLGDITMRLLSIKESCDKSIILAIQITNSERLTWQINDVLSYTKLLIQESEKFITTVESRRAEFQRNLSKMQIEDWGQY